MADLSQLFTPQVIPGVSGRVNGFEQANIRGTEFKRRRVMQEALERDLAPEDGDEFFDFVGKRMLEMGDIEGVFAVAQKREEMQQQATENQFRERGLQVQEGGLEQRIAQDAAQIEQQQADRAQRLDEINARTEGQLSVAGLNNKARASLAREELAWRTKEAELDRQLDADQAGAESDFKESRQLGRDFASDSKDFKLQVGAMRRIQQAAADPSGAGDLALIFNYMKMLDPGSTVREGEFATAQNSAGVPQRITAMYNQILQGTRLSKSQRDDFVNRAGRIFVAERDAHTELRDGFRSAAKEAKISDRFIMDYVGGLADFEPPSFTPDASTRPPPPE